MKKLFKNTIVALMAIGVAGLVSCQNDNAGSGGAFETEKAVVTIALDAPTLTRASGSAPSGDTAIRDFNIFITDQNGNAAWKEYVTVVADESNIRPYEIEVTTSAKRIYIIANAGNQTANFTSQADLEAAKIDLAAQYSARWATGGSAADIEFTNSGTTWSASETVTLQFAAARITVKVDNRMTGYTGAAGTVVLTDVALMNVRGQSKLFPASGSNSLIPSTYDSGKKFLEGIAYPGTQFSNYPATGNFTMDYTRLTTDYAYAVSPLTTDFYFYVFENEAATNPTQFPTIITVAGNNVDGDPTYFPVHLATYEQWATGALSAGIERGKSYDVTITLTGDATKDNGGGTDDPTDPEVKATLDVTLSIADWVPVVLEKEF